jgi:hypothetical protein
MSPIDEEITALLLTRAIDPVPQVRAAAGALAREIEVNGPIATHLESSLKAVSRDFGWEVAQEARFLVADLNLTPGSMQWGVRRIPVPPSPSQNFAAPLERAIRG